MPGRSFSSYPLESVLRKRSLELDRREAEVREAWHAVDEMREMLGIAESRVRQLQSEGDMASSGAHRHVRRGSRAREIHERLAHVAQLKARLEQAIMDRDQARERLLGAQQRLEDARRSLADAVAALRAVERHRDRYLEMRRRRAEQKAEEDP